MDENRSRKVTVLVIGRDRKVAEEARHYIQSPDLKIASAVAGDAFSVLPVLRPDLVLVEAALPGTTGPDACSRIRSMRGLGEIPVILVVHPDDVDRIQRGFDAGATDMVTQPVNWLILGRRIRNLVLAGRAADNLAKSEARLSRAQRIARLGSWEYDSKTRVFICSSGLARIFNRGPGEFRFSYQEFMDHVHPDELEDFERLFQQALNRQYTFKLEHRISLPGGGEKYALHQVSIFRDSHTKKNRLAGTVQDITERKFSDFLERDRNRVLELIIQNKPFPEILTQIIHIIERQRPDAGVLISLLRKGKLQPTAHSRLPERFVEHMAARTVGPRSESGGTAVYTGDLVITTDTATSPLWEAFRDTARQHDIRACFAMPISSGRGQVFGMISLYYREACHPGDEDSNLLKITAELASVAIQRVRLTEKLLHQARHDALTGLPNRTFLAEWLAKSLAEARRYKDKMALLYLDLDRFKQVNDSLGHEVGDILLKEAADRIKSAARETDVLARMGGDEFVLALSRTEGKLDAEKVCQRILELFSRPFMIRDNELYIDASIGVSLFPEDAKDSVMLQKNADTAMYYSKNQGGGTYRFFTSDMSMAVIERLEIENDLRKALERREFELFYQPQYELKEKKLVGFEALIRWNHPDLGRVQPNKFIPVAEESGLVVPIGAWVLNEACRQNKVWEKSGYGPFRVAVNVSMAQFVQEDFLDIVRRALEETGLAPERLEIELTETMFMEDMETVASRLKQIKEMGLFIAIDDFGTGYSSMSYLRDLTVDCVKIDRAFVLPIEEPGERGEKGRELLKNIVNLAHSLDCTTIAEGFESLVQFEFLRDIGCDMGQGFFLGTPMSVDEIEHHCGTDMACTVID